MIFRVLPREQIESSIIAQIADYGHQKSEAISRQISEKYSAEDRDFEIQMYEKFKQTASDSLAILNEAIQKGRAYMFELDKHHPNALIAFSVREDGMIRCFSCDDYIFEFSEYQSCCDLSGLSSKPHGILIAQKYLERETAANNPYGIAYFMFMLVRKTAVYEALCAAKENGAGESDVIIDGEVIQHISAHLEGDGLEYVAYPVLKDYFGPID